MNKRTALRFFKKDCAVCPRCGGDDFYYGKTESSGQRIYQRLTCNACTKSFHIGATIDTVWREDMTGYEAEYCGGKYTLHTA
jgi:uncharacterized protein YbaR (Trm112 family)